MSVLAGVRFVSVYESLCKWRIALWQQQMHKYSQSHFKASLQDYKEKPSGTHRSRPGDTFLNRCNWRRDFTIQNKLILRDWIDCLYRILDWYIFLCLPWIFFYGFTIEDMDNFDNVFLLQLRNLQTVFNVHITLAEKLNMSRQWCDYQGTHYPSQPLHFL